MIDPSKQKKTHHTTDAWLPMGDWTFRILIHSQMKQVGSQNRPGFQTEDLTKYNKKLHPMFFVRAIERQDLYYKLQYIQSHDNSPVNKFHMKYADPSLELLAHPPTRQLLFSFLSSSLARTTLKLSLPVVNSERIVDPKRNWGRIGPSHERPKIIFFFVHDPRHDDWLATDCDRWPQILKYR